MEKPMIMSEEAVAARREYTRNYRKANPERVRAWNKRYWEKRAKRMQQQRGKDVATEEKTEG